MAAPNVWNLLFDEEHIKEADELVAAAIGADVDPTVFSEQVARVCDRVAQANSAKEIAAELMPVVGVLAGLARAVVGDAAEVLYFVKRESEVALALEQGEEPLEEGEPDEVEEAKRAIALSLLQGAVAALLDTHRGGPRVAGG